MYLTHLTAGYDAHITNAGHEFLMQAEGRGSKQTTQLSQVGTSYSQCPYQCMLQLAKPSQKATQKAHSQEQTLCNCEKNKGKQYNVIMVSDYL